MRNIRDELSLQAFGSDLFLSGKVLRFSELIDVFLQDRIVRRHAGLLHLIDRIGQEIFHFAPKNAQTVQMIERVNRDAYHDDEEGG